MCNFNENPVDCFDWGVLSSNYIVNNEEYPRFEIKLNGFYKEGSAIDPYKFSNMSRLIEDRMNGREGEKEKMNPCKITAEKVKTINSEPKNKIITKTMLNSTYGAHYYDNAMTTNTNTTNIAGSFTCTVHAPMDTKVRDSFEKTYIEYGKAFKALERYSSCQYPIPQIKNVIFNYPATIVFWNDGTKTVVKCDERDQFDPEKGITMAFFKKMHGNIGHYFEEIKKWAKKYEDKENKAFKDFLNSISNSIDWSVKKTPDNPRWHIWYKIGMLDEIHCYEKDYSTKYSAVRRAKKLCECDDYNITIWTVSQKAHFGPESDDVEWYLN